MDTVEILRFVLPYQRHNVFKGVFACDNLPTHFTLPALFIVNLSPKSEPGTHWVSIVIDREKKSYYFDSFGLKPQNVFIQAFLDRHSIENGYNKLQLQHITSNKCGKYCCVFALSVLNHKSVYYLMKKFSKNLYINDIFIESMFKYRNLRATYCESNWLIPGE